MEKPKYNAPSVDAAARILKLLSRFKTQKSTLTEISELVQVSKSTCLRILKTLEFNDFVLYNSDLRKYSLGVYPLILGSRASETLDYVSYMKPFLEEATKATKMTSVLVQPTHEQRMMYVLKNESTANARVNVSVGNRFPITSTSYGKWLLAYTSEEERQRILEKGLPKVTKNTVTDKNTYKEQLKRIRKTGVLISKEEYIPGVCAISCPVFDHEGSILGVIAVLEMMSVVEDKNLNDITYVLKDISHRCSFKTTNNTE